jgi:hypothetical protein
MIRSRFYIHFWAAVVASGALLTTPPAKAETPEPCDQGKKTNLRVEMTLSKDWKGKTEEIRASFQTGSEAIRVKVEFFPFLNPPKNIGIGRCVTAEEARLAFRQAIAYNRGVEALILQEVVPARWIGIGTTKVAELSWVAISPDDLKGLMDPALSDDGFQALYRQLARLKERKRPFGMGPVPYE